MSSTGPRDITGSSAGVGHDSLQPPGIPLSRSSSSAVSITSASPAPSESGAGGYIPRPPRRRSTDNSGLMEYYYSSAAGRGSSSSLGISPSPSASALGQVASGAALSPSSPSRPIRPRSRSHQNLEEMSERVEHLAHTPLPGQLSRGSTGDFRDMQGMQGPSPASGKADGFLPPIRSTALGFSREEVESPGGWSASSDYSNRDSVSGLSMLVGGAGGVGGVGRMASLDSDYGESPNKTGTYQSLLDEGRVRQEDSSIPEVGTLRGGNGRKRFDEMRDSVTTIQPERAYDSPNLNKTPTFTYQSPSLSQRSPAQQVTPTRPDFPQRTSPSASASNYTPGSGRTRRFASPPLESMRLSEDIAEPNRVPLTAPPIRGAFENGDLPIPARTGSDVRRQQGKEDVRLAEAVLRGDGPSVLPEKGDVQMAAERKPITPVETSLSREQIRNRSTPGKSPEPPPRSSMRNNLASSSSSDLLDPQRTTPLSVSPRSSPQTGSMMDLPVITHTSNSPDPSLQAPPTRPSRSPSRANSEAGSASIHELTEMLGGAMQEMGLSDPQTTSGGRDRAMSAPLDSRTTEIAIDKSGLGKRDIARPALIPTRSGSLPQTHSVSRTDDTSAMPPPPLPHSLRRPESSSSLRPSTNSQEASLKLNSPNKPVPNLPTSGVDMKASPLSPGSGGATLTGMRPRPWPPAMMFGNIKVMKSTGDRANAYTVALNELRKAETGLREWTAAAAAGNSELAGFGHNKMASVSSLGVRNASMTSIPSSFTPHMRNFSTSSDLPVRIDSYGSRDMSPRFIDPNDHPGPTPANPSGMKPSQSMASVASTSSRRGFFSNIGKKGGKKESTAPGPPGSTSKKDIRGLPISSPTFVRSGTPPNDSNSSPQNVRPPRIGSYTPPASSRDPGEASGRSSLDTGLTRMAVPAPRGSLDVPPSSRNYVPFRGSPMAQGQWSRDQSPQRLEDIKALEEILPHVERPVLGAYLSKYGDKMTAIGAYLEDEKRGSILKT